MEENYFMPCSQLPAYEKWDHAQLAITAAQYHRRMIQQQEEIQGLRHELADAKRALARNGDDWR